MYTVFEFSKWPFRMLIKDDDEVIVGVDRAYESTADTLATCVRRTENIKQYATINQLVERANRCESAERTAAELRAQLATAQAALERVTAERDAAQSHIEAYLEKFDGQLSNDDVKRWLYNSWIPQSRRLI